MCQQCNDSLVAAATAANLLASAANTLYNMNSHEAANALAKAAAQLFEPAVEAADNGKPEGKSGGVDPAAEARREANASLPKGFVIGDDDIVRLDGAVIGRAVLIKRPTQH